VLVRRLGARFICVGPDFRFGRGGRAGVRELGRWAKRHGYRLAVVAPVRSGGAAVSSTRIREAIRRGELRRAAALLGRPVSLYGRVVRGHARGRRLGFPTVNLRLAHETLPPPGVYAVHARCTGRSYGGTLHLGPRPTFGEAGLSAEVYLLDTHKSFYGKEMEIFILRRLRAVRRFPDPARLVRQIERDVRRTRRILRTGRP
jgi:riboflavin kinase/FMN adenylyltransferase